MTFFNLRGVPRFAALALVLVVAAGSGAVAGSLITSADIKNNTIRARDIHNGTIKSRDIADGTISKADIDPALIRELSDDSGTNTPGGGGDNPPADTTPPPVPVASRPTGIQTTAVVTWMAVAAGDLAGYNFYRSADAGATWQKVNTALITGTSADGGNPATGNTVQDFQFSVTSVDTSGNESARSNSVAYSCLQGTGCV